MNVKKMLAGVFAVAIVLLSACGDDEKPSPKNQFDFEGDAVLLKGANLYLMYEGEDGSGHIYRDYFITDGTYSEGSGWSIGSYTNATYLIAVEVGVPADEELSPGSYPLYGSFSDAPETSNISWVSFENETEYYYTDVTGGDPVVISGNFDDGDTMTISLKGSLEYDNNDESVEGRLYFKGEVQDLRAPLARKESAVAGGARQ
jgi:hypothetical protein